MDESLGVGVVMGGAHGQLWRGRTLSALRPMFLDRVPLEVASFGDGQKSCRAG